jgi:hypothetical protein
MRDIILEIRGTPTSRNTYVYNANNEKIEHVLKVDLVITSDQEYIFGKITHTIGVEEDVRVLQIRTCVGLFDNLLF